MKTTLLRFGIATALILASLSPVSANSVRGKQFNSRRLREGTVGQSREQIVKWFGTPDSIYQNGMVYEYGLVDVTDAESLHVFHKIWFWFSGEEGGEVKRIELND